MDCTTGRVYPVPLLCPVTDKHSKHSLWLLASAPRQVRCAGIPSGWTSQLRNRALKAVTIALQLRPRLKRVDGITHKCKNLRFSPLSTLHSYWEILFSIFSLGLIQTFRSNKTHSCASVCRERDGL